jgi:hypothetical protein
MAGKHQVIAGSVKNTFRVAGGKVLPDQVKAAMHAQMTKPESQEG